MKKSMLPSDFEQYLTVTKYELLGYLRKKRLWVVLIIIFLMFFLVLLLLPALGVDYPRTFRGYSEAYLSFVSIIALLCATFFGSDSLVGEFQQKTGFVVFPNPVRRRIIFLGKFTASMLASILVILIYYGLIALFVGGIYKGVNFELIYSFLVAITYLLAVIGLAYFISAVMKGTIGSTVLTFILLLFILPMIGGALNFAGVEPWFFVTQGGDSIANVMDPSYEPGKFCTQADIETEFCFFLPDTYVSIAVMFGYFFIFILLALLVFQRKEMVG
jgi:ABC-2 type transport system permease protein